MESNTNSISSARLHRLDQRQHRSETEEVDVRQGQNALGSLLLSTGLSAIVARNYKSRSECEIQITASQLVSSLVSCIQAQNLV